MTKLIDILTLIFYGPFLWMLLLGILLGSALKRRLEFKALPYAPLIDEVDDGMLMRHIVSCLVVGTLLMVATYLLKVVLPDKPMMLLWFALLIVQLVGASGTAVFFAAPLAAGVYALMGDATAGDFVGLAMVAGLYQLGYGLLLFVGSPKTYPVIGQEKDGRIVGKQIYARVFLLPILGMQPEFASGFSMSTLMMMVIFLYSRHTLVRQTVGQFTLRHGLFHTISGALVVLLVLAEVLPIVAIFAMMVVLAVGWLIYDRLWVKKQDDLYIVPAKSLCVLYVRHGSVGYQMGLKAGDQIVTVNGNAMIRPEAMDAFLTQYPPQIWLEVEREGKKVTLEYKDYQEGIGELGVMFMPREIAKYEIYNNKRWLS